MAYNVHGLDVRRQERQSKQDFVSRLEVMLMSEFDFEPGDCVIYRDQDQIEWRPWVVIEANGDSVTLDVEKAFRYSVKASILHKLAEITCEN